MFSEKYSVLGIKSEYWSSNPVENCNELKFITIDFIAPDNMIKKELKILFHIIYIDISNYSYWFS